MLKKGGLFFSVVIVLVGVYYHNLFSYAFMQAKGQFHIVWNAKPIHKILANPATPDSTKQRLQLVDEIRAFAFDSLGLNPTQNYTTFYNQNGQPLLWVVTACAPYKFEPVEWSFPIIGSFTYKGFFEKDKAINLAKELKKQGYDLEVSDVSGWSTLGWLKDPVLSNMIEGSDGSLANTLLHELTHGTLFIPDSMTFNENLASFVGQKGALLFLAKKFGASAPQVHCYAQRIQDSQRFNRFMIAGATKLDSLYRSIQSKPDTEKKRVKAQFMTNFVASADTVAFTNRERYQKLFKNKSINNAVFISFLKYRERQGDFQKLYEKKFNSNLRNFIAYWKNRYPI